MKVLVVYKKSTYKLNEENGSLDSLPDNVRKEFKESHDANEKALDSVMGTLGVMGVDWEPCYRADLTKAKIEEFQNVITVGGDGTVLDASHLVNKGFLLGVNSDPKRSVGFLCAATAENFPEIIKDVEQWKLVPTVINRIDGDIDGKSFPFPVLNDVLVCQANPAAVSRYDVDVNKDGGGSFAHKCSGMWVSTPMGSTAAISSAGGVKRPLGEKVVQYKARELMAGSMGDHYAAGTTDVITFVSRMREGRVFFDGCHYKMPFSIGQKLTIKIGKVGLNLFMTEQMKQRRENF